MTRKFNLEIRESASKAFNPQRTFDQYGFPFTCNPTIGCHFGCKYCYSPIFVKKQKENKRRDFFEQVILRKKIPALLEKELGNYRILPQHLKRVQINETNDYYLPRIINSLQNSDEDIMYQILDIFHRHWKDGNKWMLHILTKSPLIKYHSGQIERYEAYGSG